MKYTFDDDEKNNKKFTISAFYEEDNKKIRKETMYLDFVPDEFSSSENSAGTTKQNINKNKSRKQVLARMQRNQNDNALLVGMKNGADAKENSVEANC